jgi:hypothetical protein
VLAHRGKDSSRACRSMANGRAGVPLLRRRRSGSAAAPVLLRAQQLLMTVLSAMLMVVDGKALVIHARMHAVPTMWVWCLRMLLIACSDAMCADRRERVDDDQRRLW